MTSSLLLRTPFLGSIQSLIGRLLAHRSLRHHDVRLQGDSGQNPTQLLQHELRTPLSGILGMASLLRSSGMSGEQRRLLAALEKSGQQMERLLERMSSPQAVSGAVANLKPEAFDGAMFLDQLVRAHWPSAQEKSLGLYLDFDSSLPCQWVSDKSCLRQLLDNLLANAIKFTNCGHVLLKALPSGPVRGERSGLELRVVDTGMGIPWRYARRMYAAGEQGHRCTAQHPGGAGLGLHVCRNVVDALGGRIKHSSRPGRGTCFKVVLPAIVKLASRGSGFPRPGLLADLKCGLLLDTPARDVVENVLRRMGIRVVRTLSKLAGGPGPEVDVVFCEAARAMAVDRPGLDLPDPSGLVLLRRTWPQAHGEQGQATSAGVLHLPNPVLRSNLEPLLLGLELQNRLRCVSDMRGSDVAGC